MNWAKLVNLGLVCLVALSLGACAAKRAAAPSGSGTGGADDPNKIGSSIPQQPAVIVPKQQDPKPPEPKPPVVPPAPIKTEVLPQPGPPHVDPPVPPVPPPAAAHLEPVRFDYDAYTLDPEALAALERIYQALAGSRDKFVLEGYCDERGNDQYNILLGENRAKAALNWLVTRGIEAGRLSVISYGREFPADTGHSPEAWRSNRRVEIVPVGTPAPGARRRAADK